jgi:hypothetical protein
LTEENYQHLLDELMGGKYGEPSRPELELHIVGYKAKNLMRTHRRDRPKSEDKPSIISKKRLSQKFEEKEENNNGKAEYPDQEPIGEPKDESRGRGVGVLYDQARQMYILSEKNESKLLLLIKNDPEKANQILKINTRFGGPYQHVNELNYVDSFRERVWRRFVRLQLAPLIDNEDRMKLVLDHYVEYKDEEYKTKKLAYYTDENGIIDKRALSDSDDSWSSDDEKPKIKRKTIRKSLLVNRNNLVGNRRIMKKPNTVGQPKKIIDKKVEEVVVLEKEKPKKKNLKTIIKKNANKINNVLKITK